MSSPPKSSPTNRPSPSSRSSTSSSSVHQRLSLLTQSSGNKPFIKNKSQTTSSLHFPSFRFSPDSEEIEEIVEDTGAAESDEAAELMQDVLDEPHEPPPTQSASSSSTGGDISPLKEYILKHKWANKWDKRSLSLDLDLKGKIITAIEDKRRSFVSHFYNEEDEEDNQLPPTLLTSSHSIPEQLAASALDDEEDLSVHSDSALVQHHQHGNRLYNFEEENCSDYYEFYQGSPAADDLKDLVVEEIGVEADEDDIMEDTSFLREFVLPPEKLEESFGGLPTLYQPPSVVLGRRPYPIQQLASGWEPVVSPEQEDEYIEKKMKPGSFKSLIRKLIYDIVYNNWVRYWIGLLAFLIAFDVGKFLGNLLWFLLGGFGTMLCWNVLGGSTEECQRDENLKETAKLSVVEMDRARGRDRVDELYWKSQGWMLTLPPTSDTKSTTQCNYPNYDAFNFHLRATKVVFVRLSGPTMIISHPHTRHRVPKRRLWNDPRINTDHIFVRHQQFNLFGAKVEIVPHGLAKKRAWCKKYPIAITFASRNKYVGKLLNVNQESTATKNISPDDGASVSFKDGNVKLGNDYKGEVYKEDGSCSGKTIYLFARTDREKDDWFRRFSAATKINNSWSTPPPSTTYDHFISYMKKACPTLRILPHSSPHTPSRSPRSTTPTNELFESVSVRNVTTAIGGSPASSRKSTPEKEIKSSHNLISPTFLNALVARLFYDFLRSPTWTHEVKQLIDRKLFFIRKPAFVQSLKVKELDLGDSLPITNNVSAPVLDRQGLWVDMDISYIGNMVITLEAFINFLKMGKNDDVERDMESSTKPKPSGTTTTTGGGGSKSPKRHAMFDSDADDSGESSESDEDFDLEEEVKTTDNAKSTNTTTTTDNRGKLMKYADTLAKSSVMRNKHVQKVVTNIAATPFMLTVEIKRVIGSVAINIPPVPNDRVWIGFRSNPIIEINVRPKVGERVVSLSQVTGWIKKKILLEFQRVMVCPNMMDITIPLMEFELPK